MIIAEPYFLSQLQRSSIRSTFSSYLATTFTLSNFAFLAHATLTSKKVTSCSPSPLAPAFLWVLIEWLYRSTLIDGRDGQCSVLLCLHVSSQ